MKPWQECGNTDMCLMRIRGIKTTNHQNPRSSSMLVVCKFAHLGHYVLQGYIKVQKASSTRQEVCFLT